MDSIMVENSITLPQLEAVLYEFAGSSVVVTGQKINELFRAAKIPNELHSYVTEHLVKLSFLGMEVGFREFAFSEEPKEYRKNVILAGKIEKIRRAAMSNTSSVSSLSRSRRYLTHCKGDNQLIGSLCRTYRLVVVQAHFAKRII